MILGVIPARGGGKGIPKKNIKLICGKPLIAWSIIAAQKSKLLDDFIVSTEDFEIAEVARSYGANVLDRPAALASDEATTVSVFQHVVDKLNPDIIVILQPTSPIRDDDLIDKCISKYLDSKLKCDNLATGFYCKAREFGTYDNLRRQDLKGFFYDDGNVYVVKKEIILNGRWSGDNIIKYPISREQNYEIDDDIDFFIVEKLLEKRYLKKCTKNLQNIKLLAMDVDGVLTDAGMYYSEDNNELKKFCTRDGKGIELVRNAGIKTAILTQEETEIVKKRAKKLQIDYLFQHVHNKLEIIQEIANNEKLLLGQVAYIGDDLNDLETLKAVGFSATPSDGIMENKKVVDYICQKKGGEGCVREICELIIASKIQIKKGA